MIFNDPVHKRDRILTWWSIHFTKDGLQLSGIVSIEGNEPPLEPGAQFRLTYTSNIKEVEENVVTTISGSKYTLVGPPRQPLYPDYIYNPQYPLTGIV
jgi:hypothetical protein